MLLRVCRRRYNATIWKNREFAAGAVMNGPLVFQRRDQKVASLSNREFRNGQCNRETMTLLQVVVWTGF